VFRIVISGWYGYKNTGDEVILASMIKTIRDEFKDVEIIVLSSDPAYTSKVHDVVAVPLMYFDILSLCSLALRKRLFETVNAIRTSDVFILGGGGFLSDWQSWTVILQWLGQVMLAKMFGKKVMLYAIGAGPIITKIGRFLTRIILNRCADIITVRDEKSKEWLESAGVKKRIYVTADPAILLEPVKPDRISKILKEERIDSSKPLVGIAISPIFHIQKYWPNQQKKFLKFKNVWPKVVDFIISKLDANVIFIPMQIPTDRDFASELIKNVENKDRVKIITGEYTPQEMMGIIGRMDMIIGMRLHSLILATRMNVPVLGIMYHHKVECFLEQIGQKKWAVGIGEGIHRKNEDINIEELLYKLSALWICRKRYKKEIKEKMAYLKKRAKLNNNFLVKLLR